MPRVIAGMTISIDGFVTDRHGSVAPLFSDLASLGDSEYMRELQADVGAVLMGRRTFEMAEDPDSYADSYEFQVPIFVVTHSAPESHPQQNERLTFTFVPEGVDDAVVHATTAAGDRAVMVVGGADLIRQLLQRGLVDELHVDVMPVLLGSGIRLFDDSSLGTLPLEKLDVIEVGERTCMRFKVPR